MSRQQTVEKQSRQRQRQKLIDACISALYVHGPSRTTIDKVVTIADMSPGIVNFYFETKAALLVAALEHLAEEFEERVCKPLDGQRDMPVAALQRLIELYLDPDIASPRKVSVWYAFWGEASARQEYYDICGKRDLAFAELVRDLMARLIAQTGATHLDADAIALGLIGSLEMIWQEIAFQDEGAVDRAGARARCQAYLRSLFPAEFGAARAQFRVAPSGSLPAAGLADGFRALVAAEFSLVGLHAMAVPAGWGGYDVLVQPASQGLQRVAVRIAADGIADLAGIDRCDWVVVVALPASAEPGRTYFVVPFGSIGSVARLDVTSPALAPYKGNFSRVGGAAAQA